MSKRRLIALACFCLVAAGCWDKEPTPVQTVRKEPTAFVSEQREGRSERGLEGGADFHARLLGIAATYAENGRAMDSLIFSIGVCSAPPPLGPPLHVSTSKDSQTHGRKLFTVFARVHEGSRYYSEKNPNPVGQVVVKESWLPEEIADKGQFLEPLIRKVKVHAKDASDNTKMIEIDDYFVPYARSGGRLYHAAKQGPLFIMFKTDPKTPETDEGWVYGTVTADGKEATSVGRVESCMRCHQKAPHDRLFGLPK